MGQQGSVDDVKLGLANIEFGGTALGLTKGGVTVNLTQEVTDVIVDNWGETAVASFDKGVNVEVVVPMAEETLAKLNLALPTSTLTGSGKLTLGTPSGNEITTGLLVVNPITAGRPNFVAYKARPTSAITVNYNLDDISVIEVTFKALIDSDRAEGDQLCRFGGPAS